MTMRSRGKKEAEKLIEEKVAHGEVRRYAKGRFLGKGGFARVYELTCVDTKQTYAGKVIAKSSLTKSRAKQKLMSEIKIHRSLKHVHIVNFEHFFEDSENVYFLLELCPNQTMNELLRRRKRLTELEVQCYILQIISALRHVHSRKVVHRDVKIGNIFINDRMEVKLGDFGLACKLEFDGQRRRTICGTPNYIAPEVLDGKTGHSFEADCWSLGVVIYTLLVGKPPFETNDVKKTYNLIRMNAYAFPESIGLSDQAKSLVTRMLKLDPAKRPTLEDVQKHEFFHMNKIPALLPASTLAVPPSNHYLAQFHPDSKNVPYVPTMDTAPVKDVEKLNKEMGNTQRVRHSHSPPKEETVWVKKWVDYSTKYGLGYVLSNGSAGVYYNDSSKILLPAKSNRFYYIERNSENRDNTNVYELESYPKSLYKKATLLQHFKSYLEYDQDTYEDSGFTENPVYVKKWMRTKRAIMFRLSNKVIQVSFQDHTEVILSNQNKRVTYVNKKGERHTMRMSEALESNNTELTKRLKYTKEVLNYMMVNAQTTGTNRDQPLIIKDI